MLLSGCRMRRSDEVGEGGDGGQGGGEDCRGGGRDGEVVWRRIGCLIDFGCYA